MLRVTRLLGHRRHFLRFAAAIAFLLAVVICALWARSYWRYEGVWRDGGDSTYRSLISTGGRLAYSEQPGIRHGPRIWRYQVIVLPQMTPYRHMVEPTTWY